LYILTTDLLLLTVTLTNGRPVLSSEREPHMDRTEIFEHYEISGHEPQTWLDIKTSRLTVSRNVTLTGLVPGDRD
jgi:hypothetical protein